MSHSTDDSRPAAGKPTLEMLLRLKRAERPDAAFWEDFERGLRQKQLAAIVEPKPWWLGLALLGRRLTPAGLPISAAAAALLAVMVVRTQSPFVASSAPIEFGPSEVAQTGDSAAPVAAGVAMIAPVAPLPEVASAVAPAHPDGEDGAVRSPSPVDAPPSDARVAAAEAAARASATHRSGVAASLLELASLEVAAPTPSQLTIAQNLAALRAEAPELVAAATRLQNPERVIALPDDSGIDPDALKMEVRNPRHARVLLAMAENGAVEAVGGLSHVRDRMVRSLDANDAVAGSASRLGVGGDRLSLSF